ncbi:MAG: hypothetical protein ACLUPV_10450 [Bilophila wadsworthia]
MGKPTPCCRRLRLKQQHGVVIGYLGLDRPGRWRSPSIWNRPREWRVGTPF